jgi:prepilin-type N-terminal cleavage/methylation domain-containing protein
MATSQKPKLRAPGFTLVEVVVVLFIFGIVIAMAAAITRSITAGQKLSVTASRLAAVDAAIVQFVAVQKRLPCPANGRLANSDNAAGLEILPDATGCAIANQQYGVVPWRALGLTEQEMTDGWDRRFSYRVWPALGIQAPPGGPLGGMDMSQCDPAGTEPGLGPKTCTGGCTSANLLACTPPLAFLTGKGLIIRNVAGTVMMDPALGTGAAYVLISAGESGGGAYLSSGVLGSTVSGGDGNLEQTNYADLVAATTYVDDAINSNPGAAHFDDLVSRPSILSVATKAGLAPRAH